MVQAVNLPDGSQINFPDEMSADAIQAAMPDAYKQAQFKTAQNNVTQDPFNGDATAPETPIPDWLKTGASAAYAPFKPIVNNTIDNVKASLTQTGADISEPVNSPNVPASLQVEDTAIRGVAKVGNVIGGLFGVATAPVSGAIQASAEPAVKPIGEALQPFTGGNAENLTPEVSHEIAGQFGGDVTNALFAAEGSKAAPENLPIDRSKPPVLDSVVTAAQDVAKKIDATQQQEDALGRFALGLRNPTTLTPEQTQAALASGKEIKAIPGSDTALTPDHIDNLKSLAQDATDSGVPVQGIKAMVDAHLPGTYDKQALLDQIIPPSAKNIAEATPEIATATGVPDSTIQGLLLPKDSGIQDVTSENVAKQAIEAVPVGKKQLEGILGSNPITRAIKGIYQGFANNYGILDNICRVYAKNNGLDIGRNDILELADTAMAKNIADRGNYGGLSYLGDMEGTNQSVYRNAAGTSELKEDTSIKPYMTVKQEALAGGLDQPTLDKINLARNSLDDYANLERVAADHAQTITSNTQKIIDLRTELDKPENGNFLQKFDIQSQIAALLRENESAANSAKELSKRQSLMSKEDATATMSQYENNPAATQYIDGLNKIHGALLDDLVTAGKITPELSELLKSAHPNFIPAFRTAEDFTFDLGQNSGWRGTTPKAFQKREISNRAGEQVDVEGNIVRNILSSVNKRESAQVRGSLFQMLYKQLDDNAWDLAFREKKADVGKALVNLAEGSKAKLSANDITPANPNRLENYKTVTFDINGKQIELSLKDENLYKSLANSYGQFESGNTMLKSAIFLARLKREGIIDMDPTFPFRNALRGGMDFPVNARRMIPIKDYTPVLSPLKTAVGTFFDQKFYDRYSMNYGFGNKLSKDYGMKGTEQIVKMVKGNEAPSGVVHATTNFMHNVNSRIDAGTRILQYKVLYNKLLAEGKTDSQAHEAAMIASKEAHLRFNQRGANNSLNVITQTIPLMRTFINSADKSIKMGLYSPATWSVGAAQIFMVYKAVQMYNRQYVDKDGIPFVDKLDTRIKADGMPIYYGNTQNSFFTYPLGWITGRTMPAIDYTTQYLGNAYHAIMHDKAAQVIKQVPEMKGKITGQQVVDAWMDWAFKWMTPESSLPPPLALGVGLAQNKDDNGNALVPQSLNNSNTPSHLQYFVNSTGASLISLTNDLHTKYGVDISPAKAQFVARELMGTFGETSMKAGAHLYAAMSGANPPAPERGDIPGFKLFSGNTSDVPLTGIDSKYHNVGAYLQQIQAQANILKQKSTDYPEASLEYNKFLQDHSVELYWSAKFKEADKMLTKTSAAMEQTIISRPGSLGGVQETNPSIFGDEKKRNEITRLREEVQSIQHGVLQGIVNDLDKGNVATNDIWSHATTHNPITDIINSLMPSQNPPKPTNDKSSDASPIMNFLHGLNPISDAKADTLEQPPAINQEAQQPKYEPSFFQKFLPNLRAFGDNMYKDDVINYTITKQEGTKFTETPGDRGGATKFGITLKTLQQDNPKATADDVKNLTQQQAVDIYKKKYWDAGQVDKMPVGVQDVVFDMNVNTGLGGSTIIVQRALKSLGADIDVDGKLGTATLNAMNKADTDDLRAAITTQRQKWYEDIVKHDPSQAKFLPDWKKRTEDMQQVPQELQQTEA